MGLDYLLPVACVVLTPLIFAVYTAPKIPRWLEFGLELLQQLADWWISL